MSERKLTIAAAIATLVCPSIAAAGPAAAGTELCTPQAFGVPGPQPKTPEWWNAAAPGKEQRWTGATRSQTRSISTGTPMAWTQAIWDRATHTLYFRYEVRSDPVLNTDLDRVVMTMTDNGPDGALFVQVQPIVDCIGSTPDTIAAACTGEGRAVPASAVRYAEPSSPTSLANWTVPSTTNPKAADYTVEHAWTQIARRNVGTETAPLYVFDWTVQVAVTFPVDATGEAGPNARFFANTIVQAGSVTMPGNNLQFPTICNATSPVSLTSCQVTGSPDDASGVPDNITTWEPLRTSQQCAGVSLEPMLVGSDYNLVTGVLDGTSYAFPGNQIPRTTGARLRAGIRNTMGRALTSGEVRARFRIAGWGATYADWDDATWTEVGTADLAGALSGVDATHPNGHVAYMAGQGTLGMSSVFAPGASIAYDHQCIHVQLESVGAPAPGQELRFANDSVYRNMDLVTASVFRRNAEINLVGLPEPEVPRRVLLLVDTRHMPAQGDCWVMPEGDDVRQWSGTFGCWQRDQKTIPPVLADPEKQEQGVATPDELPTWAAHAFLETGDSVVSNGQSSPIWVPFSGWGYWVEHEGQVWGWEHRLHGATKPPNAPHNVYMIETPPNRVVTVATTIRTIDAGNEVCPAAGAPGPLPAGCDEPQLPPPREVKIKEQDPPRDGPICCTSSSKGQGTAHGMIMFGILLGLRRGRRRSARRER